MGFCLSNMEFLFLLHILPTTPQLISACSAMVLLPWSAQTRLPTFPVSGFPFPIGVLGAKQETGNWKLETGNAKGGSKETVSNPVNGAGLQPLSLLPSPSRGSAPGWYEAAPLALELLRDHKTKGLKARFISAWGNAPGEGIETINQGLKARSIIGFETVSKLPHSKFRQNAK
jgi:hypothetical protein